MPSTDLDRLRTEYARRATNKRNEELYSSFNQAYLFAVQQRQRLLLDLLRHHGVTSLRGKAVLEIGCGHGNILSEWQCLGATTTQLHGIDILEERLIAAKEQLPGSAVLCADGQALPFASNRFDIVLQYTAFSSILDDVVRHNVAREMMRVLAKPTGTIIWYDFWLNPTNHQTKGIRPAEIRLLFQGYECLIRRSTLAPPVARRMVPVSWAVSLVLEKFGVLNTHYLAVIRPMGSAQGETSGRFSGSYE